MTIFKIISLTDSLTYPIKLNYSNNPIDHETLKLEVTSNPNITSINLSFTNSTNETLAIFKDVKTLQWIDISKNEEISFGNELLQLIQNTQLHTIIAERINIKFTEKDLQNINKDRLLEIKSLNLSNTNLTDTQLKLLINYCPNLEELNLRECNNLTTEGLQLLQEFKNLKKLVIKHKDLTQTILESIIQNNKDLEELKFGLTLDHFNCEFIKISLEQLHTLEIDGLTISKETIKSLVSAAKTLNRLIFININTVDKDLLDVLSKQLPSLTHLGLIACNVGNEIWESLRLFITLKEVDVFASSKLDDENQKNNFENKSGIAVLNFITPYF